MTTDMAIYLFLVIGGVWWLGINLWLIHLSAKGLERMLLDRASGKDPQIGKLRTVPRYERIGNAVMYGATAGVVCCAAMLALLVAHS